MEVLIVICMLTFFALIFIVMDKIDKLIAQPHFFSYVKQPMNKDKSFALVFGCTKLSEKLILLLERYGIDYQQIENENQLDRTSYYSHLFAVSESDLDNLMISVIANKMMEINEKIAVCNYLDNQKIFKQNSIRYLYGKNINAEALLYIMFPALIKPKENIND